MSYTRPTPAELIEKRGDAIVAAELEAQIDTDDILNGTIRAEDLNAAQAAAFRALLDLEPGTDLLSPSAVSAAIAAAISALSLGTMAQETATNYLPKSGNLSGLASAATARTNLGLGTAAVEAAAAFDAAGTASAAVSAHAAAGDPHPAYALESALGTMAAAAAADYLSKAGNLSGLADAATARGNLGLGSAATQASSAFDAAGAASSAVATHEAAGDPHPAYALESALGTMSTQTATDYLSKAGNLSGLANVATSRSNLGLGTMAVEVATDYLTKAGNFSGIASKSTARQNLDVAIANHLSGLTLSNNGTDANNDIDIAAGSAADSTGAYLLTLASSITKRLDAAWSVGTNQGGLDTGSKANSTWYAVHLIQRSDTGVVDALFSTSETSPTMPTNYDRRRRIGWVRTNGSGNILAFVQTGDEFDWKTPVNDFAVNNPGTSGNNRAVTAPNGTVVIINMRITDQTPATETWALFSSPNINNTTPSSTNFSLAMNAQGASVPAMASGQFNILTAAGGAIQTRLDRSDSDTYLYGVTMGYIDTRGRQA